jgi:Flp pilus assembly protein TadD
MKPLTRKETIRLVLASACVLTGTVGRAMDTGALPVADDAPRVTERLTTARKLIQAQDWNKALAELNQAALEDPRNADVHNLLGYSWRKRSVPDLAKAFEHYKTALRLQPTHKGAHEYIGEAYLMDKKPAEAEKHLAQLEKICGNRTCEEYADLARAIASYKAKK